MSSYQVLIGLNVLDESKFDEFCFAIQPLLENYRGHLCYDFQVPPAVFARRYQNINRVFTLRFNSRENMQAFFVDREYLKTRGRHVLKSIGSEQIIFGYDRNS